jgi:DNA-binding transcriptional MocR family regulator
MSKTYTKRELAYLLNCSVSTIEKDCDYLNISPYKGDRGMNLYSEKDFNLLSQLRSHCTDKTKSRESFVPNTEVEVLDIEPTISKLPNEPSALRDLPSAFNQAIDFGLSQDPLFDLELLQRISDRNYLLPATRLAPIFNITAKYLNTKKEYYYCGFVATKEVYAGGRALWKVLSASEF